MLTSNDLRLLAEKNISEELLQEQLASFAQGFPFLEIKASASVEKGIQRVSDAGRAEYIEAWKEYLSQNKKIVKFVPASGAASRMFKDLFAFLSASYHVPTTDFEKTFFDEIEHFAFYTSLDSCCLKNEGHGIRALISEGKYKKVVENLLEEKGLNYGSLPKGVLSFHLYADHVRTALEEHLVEGALYAKNNAGEVNIHLTVSPEHQPLFERLVKEKAPAYEQLFGVRYSVSFSTQKPSTDTVAADMDNKPFRDADGQMLFRPGGHGALIGNLNEVDADVVFIKNIDNVVPDSFREITLIYKQVLAGILVGLQAKIFDYLNLIDSGRYTPEQTEEMIRFLKDMLWIEFPEEKYSEDAVIRFIERKLRRPLRVCGMVKNVGEPGGGPFFTVNPDETVSLQILESSQIDMQNTRSRMFFEQGTHFNPVDLVCALKRPDGKKYNLPDFVDKKTGFISHKSKDGRELKALELPGLWNGAMSDWNTVFVEVPMETFNPVKTVNDLLRPQHQP